MGAAARLARGRPHARVHRSAIVNLDRVREIRSDGGDQICVLKGGTELAISRARRHTLLAQLGIIEDRVRWSGVDRRRRRPIGP